MSFHAAQLNLPSDAVLTVTGKNGASASYQARDIARGALWSRPLPGDSLVLSLSVSAVERPLTVLQIESFQAGYRSLGGNVPDNEHYRSLMKKAAAQTSTCHGELLMPGNERQPGPRKRRRGDPGRKCGPVYRHADPFTPRRQTTHRHLSQLG